MLHVDKQVDGGQEWAFQGQPEVDEGVPTLRVYAKL